MTFSLKLNENNRMLPTIIEMLIHIVIFYLSLCVLLITWTTFNEKFPNSLSELSHRKIKGYTIKEIHHHILYFFAIYWIVFTIYYMLDQSLGYELCAMFITIPSIFFIMWQLFNNDVYDKGECLKVNCRVCGYEATEVHHVSNFLVYLCEDCHKNLHSGRLTLKYENKLLIWSKTDGVY